MIPPRGIRARFALWFGLVGSGLVLASSVLAYLALAHVLLDGLDRELALRADALLARCALEDGGVPFEPPDEDLEAVLGAVALRWAEVRVWPDGAVLFARGAAPPEAAAPPRGPRDATYTVHHRTVEEERETAAGVELDLDDRICELVAPPPGGPAGDAHLVQVRVAADLEPLEERLDAFLLPLALLDLVFVLAAAGIGHALAGRLTRPILDLRAAALRTRGGDGGPMPRTGRGDELDDLAESLETSLCALAETLERQRRFTADAAHELRNPISAITSTAEVALRHPRDAEAARALFDDVLHEARRMGRVLEALLLLARADAGALETASTDVDLASLLRTVSARTAPLEVRGEARVRGDSALLEVLFENLVSNGARYAPPGEPLRAVLRAEGPDASVEIQDRGPGVPPELRDRIFERFSRGTEDAGPAGTAGLGLSIAAAIARHHGGSIEVADDTVGATFRVRLPRLASTRTSDGPEGSFTS